MCAGRSHHGLAILGFPTQTLCYLLRADLRGTRFRTSKNRMQFHQTAVILQLWVQLREAISALLFSETEAVWEMSGWDIVWPPSREYIFKKEKQTHCTLWMQTSNSSQQSLCCGCREKGNKLEKGTAFGFGLHSPIPRLTLCSGQRSIAGPVHRLVTHRGHFEPPIKLMFCHSGTNRERLRPNFVSGILLSSGRRREGCLKMSCLFVAYVE